MLNHVIFGKDVNVEIINGQVYVNGNHMVNLKPGEVFKDGAGTNYIDFPALFQRLLNAAGFYASQEESAGVIKDFSDMNDRFIDVSNAVPKDNVIYVNIPFEYLNAPQPIKIYGLSSKVNGPTVVINVIGMPAGSEVSIHTHRLNSTMMTKRTTTLTLGKVMLIRTIFYGTLVIVQLTL